MKKSGYNWKCYTDWGNQDLKPQTWVFPFMWILAIPVAILVVCLTSRTRKIQKDLLLNDKVVGHTGNKGRERNTGGKKL